jgi:hypothetical protein
MSSILHSSGAVIDGENDVVVFPVSDFMILKFSFEEWLEFVALVSEMNMLFESNTVVNAFRCGSCGTVNSAIEFEEVKEEDLN